MRLYMLFDHLLGALIPIRHSLPPPKSSLTLIHASPLRKWNLTPFSPCFGARYQVVEFIVSARSKPIYKLLRILLCFGILAMDSIGKDCPSMSAPTKDSPALPI